MPGERAVTGESDLKLCHRAGTYHELAFVIQTWDPVGGFHLHSDFLLFFNVFFFLLCFCFPSSSKDSGRR